MVCKQSTVSVREFLILVHHRIVSWLRWWSQQLWTRIFGTWSHFDKVSSDATQAFVHPIFFHASKNIALTPSISHRWATATLPSPGDRPLLRWPRWTIAGHGSHAGTHRRIPERGDLGLWEASWYDRWVNREGTEKWLGMYWPLEYLAMESIS